MGASAVELCTVDADGAGRGQRAVRDVTAGETVLSVPLAQCWTAAAALASPALACLGDGRPGLGERDLIVMHLLAERSAAAGDGGGGPRAGHVMDMPEQFDVPMLWSPAEIENLAGSERYALAQRLRKAAEADYWALDALLQEAGGEAAALFETFTVTLEGYLWARAALQTRSTRLRLLIRGGEGGEGAAEQTALCLPAGGADQFNHSPDIAIDCFRLTPDGMLEVVAGKDFREGEEVFISYGRELSTAQMLFTYGFAYADALTVANLGTPLPADHVTLRTVVPAQCTSSLEASRYGLLLEAVAMLEEEEGSGWEMEAGEEEGSVAVEFRLRPGAPLPRCWLVGARVMQLSEVEVGQLQASDELMSKVLAGEPVSAAHEAAALDGAGLQLMARLDAFGEVTSRLLDGLGDTGRDTRRDRLAVNLQLVEKAILQKALDAVDALKAAPGANYIL